MSARPWLATYGGHISDEIDPDNKIHFIFFRRQLR